MSTIQHTNFSGGLNVGVSDFLLKDNELTAMQNIWTYQIGKIEKVPGYAKCDASQVIDTKSVNFLHWYYRPSTQTDYLIAASDSGSDYILEYRTSGAWAAVTSATYTGRAGAQVDMENFLDKVFIVGYDAGTFLADATISGTTLTFSDTSFDSSDSAPQGKYIIRYRDLLYVLHAYTGSTLYPSRAYYSSAPSAGAITWTPATDFIEFGYDDGDELTGGVEAFDKLIVFKHFSMWRYDESTRLKIANIGCDSFRSIVKIGNIPYWFNRDGFYRWRGAQPEKISRKIQKFIDAIDASKLDEVVATIYMGEEYRAFIGDVTVDGISYTNTWVCWNTTREVWYIRCTADDVKSAANYVESGKRRAYFGNDDGFVMKFATKVDGVYADNANEINSFFITKNFDYGVPEDSKHIRHITAFSAKSQGLVITIDADNRDEFSSAQTQIINRNVYSEDINASGNRFRYKFLETGITESWEFEGMSMTTDIKEDEK
jgi:hypothetical protein